ncbi:MAG: tetratricopeptide repeat protein [Cyanobacteria bacterium NC_groundwater_1444_Ag_S-0.65um_54_12]|nr:tetratricopeptide repeat protein [Cyanobacteria bacterium NC_groundwater_1444_Ag_S-0.65um_54_12]
MPQKLKIEKPRVAANQAAGELAGAIAKARSRQRRFSFAVVGILVLAFGVTSLITLLPAIEQQPITAGQALSNGTAELEQLLRDRPRDLPAIIAQGNRYFDNGRYQAAAKAYQHVLARDPANPNVLVDYGTVLYYQKQPQAAIATYRKALNTDPRHVGAHVNLGIAYQSVGQREQADKEWRKALELASDVTERARIMDLLKNLATP